MKIPLTDFQVECVGTILDLVEDKPWLPPSYVMAHVRIESGWDPAVKAGDFATTGSVGLMQVAAATLGDMIRDGLIDPSQADQTVAANSLAAGIAYLDWCRGYLMKAWGFKQTIKYMPVGCAFNIGVGNILKGIRPVRYWVKWLAAQPDYAFVDGGR